MPEEEKTKEADSGSVTLPSLKPSLPGERYLWIVFLITIVLSPVIIAFLSVLTGIIQSNEMIDILATFASDFSFVGEYLGYAYIAVVSGTILYAFTRLTGVAFMVGIVNFIDSLLDGYESPRMEAEEEQEE